AGLAEGLAAIHACGVVHRDLKPGNVLLADDGPRVIDFGISRALDATSVTRASTVLGTAAFMSPEQVRGEPVGPPGDVFALGCVLAYAATGRSPFGEGPPHAVTHRIVYDAPDLSGLPAALAGTVGACLAKDPAARPAPERVLADLGAAPPTGPRPGAGAPWLPDAVTEDIAGRRTRVLGPEPAGHRTRTPDPGAPGPAAPYAVSAPAPGSGGPAARTAITVSALLCLLTVAALPFGAVNAVRIGAMAPTEATVLMVLCGAAAVVLAIGALLLLLRNPAGRWLVAAGGAVLALQAANPAVFSGLGHIPAGGAVVAIATAAVSAVLAALPATGGPRRPGG
ncbi:protein kinase domain-containing protein, partial [Nocardiopsis trehalosi]|uniref:protein kinase domain-containing protein n=1 Tax=Nocardiopsis trehalosi TaxID=109329 RepID=UPI000A4DD319